MRDESHSRDSRGQRISAKDYYFAREMVNQLN
jgi:hypothetical protein